MQGLFPMTSLDDTLGGYLWRIPLEEKNKWFSTAWRQR